MFTIRKAQKQDISRIAEILIFTKRMNYRSIFHNDTVSFGVLQVLPLAQEYLDNPVRLDSIWVYDDEFVKALIHVEKEQICELYVDSFFAGNGIGTQLIQYAIKNLHANQLWVLEKNTRAISFYERNGFVLSGKRMPEEGTPEFLLQMEHRMP